jgi:hypothetical protein
MCVYIKPYMQMQHVENLLAHTHTHTHMLEIKLIIIWKTTFIHFYPEK